jgi:hypothetical protein
MNRVPRGAGWILALALSWALAAGPAFGQAARSTPAAAAAPSCGSWVEVPSLYGPYRDYARTARLLGAAQRRPALLQRASTERVLVMCEDGPWTRRAAAVRSPSSPWQPQVRLLPFSSLQYYNSAYPRDANNGGVWTGRGLSAAATGGVYARWGPLSVQVAPEFLYQQNTEFEVNSSLVDVRRYSRFAYGGHAGFIDWPQRFGESSFNSIQPGQSYVRLDAFGFAGGISTENLWWGGATEVPIVLSNTAPGFPHLFLGTSAPLDIGIGKVHGELIWGRLSESNYFDERSINNSRLFAAIGGTFEPGGLDGLVIGGARMFSAIVDGFSASQLTSPYTGVLNNTLGDNEMFGLFLNWTLPRSGFRLHAEMGREDAWANLTDILGEPDHTVAYNIGVEKATRWGSHWIRLFGEAFRIQIGPRSFRSDRGLPAFYTHSKAIQGYTQMGQMLGASVGPGSAGERLGAELFAPWGMAALFGERTSYDEDAFFEQYVEQGRTDGTDRRDRELTVGVRGVLFLGAFDVRGMAALSRRRNRNFIGVSATGGEVLTERNLAFELGIAWRPAMSIPGDAVPPGPGIVP